MASGMAPKSAVAGIVLNQGPPPDHIHAIAAPLRDHGGHIVGAVSVASAAQYLPAERMAEIAPIVRDTAREISEKLGWEGD